MRRVAAPEVGNNLVAATRSALVNDPLWPWIGLHLPMGNQCVLDRGHRVPLRTDRIRDAHGQEGIVKTIKRSLGIVDQVRVALSPVSTFAVLHSEVGADYAQPNALIVAGGLLYSARTVYQWGRLAFSSWAKALGFTVLLEGVMTLSDQSWLSGLALGYLCLINAIATGVTLARGASIVVEQSASIAPAAAPPPMKTRGLKPVGAGKGSAKRSAT